VKIVARETRERRENVKAEIAARRRKRRKKSGGAGVSELGGIATSGSRGRHGWWSGGGFDEGDFFGGEAVELVNELVDGAVGGGDVAGEVPMHRGFGIDEIGVECCRWQMCRDR
jgi:hypothetical protein